MSASIYLPGHSRKVAVAAGVLWLFVLLGMTALPAGAEVYRWVDSEGKTHYGDRAPQETRAKAERVQIQSGPATVDPDAERARQQMRVMEEGRQRERAFADQRAAQDQKKKAELAQRCKSLQDDIRADRDTAVFFRYDEKGNRILWTAEERVANREQLQTLKRTYCADFPD